MINSSEFYIQGSAKQPYRIVLESTETAVIKVTCDCQAGIFGKLCKHKIQVIHNIISENSALSHYLDNSGYHSLVSAYFQQEEELKKAKSSLDKTKRSLVKLMNGK